MVVDREMEVTRVMSRQEVPATILLDGFFKQASMPNHAGGFSSIQLQVTIHNGTDVQVSNC